MDHTFLAALILNIFLILLFVFGAFSHSTALAIIFSIIMVLNAGFIVAKAIMINKSNRR